MTLEFTAFVVNLHMCRGTEVSRKNASTRDHPESDLLRTYAQSNHNQTPAQFYTI